MTMIIDKRSKNSAYIKLDNGLVVYVDTSTGEDIIKIWDNEGVDLGYEYPNVNDDGDCSVIQIFKGDDKPVLGVDWEYDNDGGHIPLTDKARNYQPTNPTKSKK